MTYFHRQSSCPAPQRKAFTLVELLIVIAIIGLLAAILFPAFRRAQEGGAQTSCASNLQRIHQAVELYRQDEKVYPVSLAVLLPTDFPIANPQGATTTVDGEACDTGALVCPNPGGAGHFKGGRDALLCANDDFDASMVRSSYGDISTDINAAMTATSDKNDMSRYVWNYWGYRAVDGTNCSATDVTECAGTAYQTPAAAVAAVTASGFDNTLLLNAATPPTDEAQLKKNPLKYSLANRFAPISTIITHCVHHRLPTASGKISDPFEMTTDPENGAMARDIVLRRDGSAKLLDVSKFHTNNNWARQNF